MSISERVSERVVKASLKFEVLLGLVSLFIFCFAVLSALLPQVALSNKLVYLAGLFAPLLLLMVKYSTLNQWLETRDVHGLVTFSAILFAAALCLTSQASLAPLVYSVVLVSAPLLLATPVKSSTWAKLPVGAMALLFVFAAVLMSAETVLATAPPAPGGLSKMGSAVSTDIKAFEEPAKQVLLAIGGGITFYGAYECYKAKQGQGDGDLASGGKKILIGAGVAGVPQILGMGRTTMGVAG